MLRRAVKRVLVSRYVAMNADGRDRGSIHAHFVISVLHARWTFLIAELGDRTLHAREDRRIL